MDDSALMDLLQITDRSFPTGSYVHSGGLEWLASQPGLLELQDLLVLRIEQQLARFELVLLLAAYQLPLVPLDRRCNAMLLPRETREASAQMGRRLLLNAVDLFGGDALCSFALEAPFAHYPVVFGAVCSALAIPPDTAAAAYAFQAIRGQISAAQRLCRLGQTEAQRILHGLKPTVLNAVSRASHSSVEEVAPFMPILDVAAMAHERSAVRLFVS